MDDNSLELEQILEEVRQADFLPAQLALDEIESSLTNTSDLPPSNVAFIYQLPDNPSKLDYAKAIMSNVEKDYGEITLSKPLVSPPPNPQLLVTEQRMRAGDIIRNRALDLQDSGGKRATYFGNKAAGRQQAIRERERRRKELDDRIAQQRIQRELDARAIREAFYNTKDLETLEQERILAEAQAAQETYEKFPGLAPPVELPTDNIIDENELSSEEVYARFASGVDWLRIRTWLAALTCIVVSYFSLAPFINFPLPQSLSDSDMLFTGILLILQLVVMLIGLDIFFTGIYDAVHGKPGIESIISLCCIATLADTTYSLLFTDTKFGVPFCFISSIALFSTMYGTRLGKSAFARTINTVTRNNSPIPVRAAWEKVDNGIVLSKSDSSTDGFMFKLTRVDYVENKFQYFSPLIIIACIVFTVVCSVINGIETATRSFATITCGAAAFTAIWSFNLPFYKISSLLANRGSALASWESAVSVNSAVAIMVKDNDLFTPENIRINSFKVSSWIEANQAILYAGSMAIKSNAGFSDAFRDLLAEHSLMPNDIADFTALDSGGVTGTIDDHKLALGSEAFMHICNVSLTGFTSNIIGAIYLAVDGAAAAVFVVHYTPTEKVQRSLIRLTRRKSKTHPLFATRDFNLTPAMLRGKFKIDLNDIEQIPYTERFKLSDDKHDSKARPIAVLGDHSLIGFANLVDSGKWLYARVRLNLLINAICAFFGLALMTFLCAAGAFEIASPDRVFIYHLVFVALTIITSILPRK